jgi:aryl-alcohol dehydrogenase-like predicted oxidoreductase
MELRSLGRSGLKVTTLGLGCNNFGMRIDEKASKAVVDACFDNGITFFDTSNSYGDGLSEEYLGKALGKRRVDAIIATKFTSAVGEGPYNKGSSRRHLIAACEDSLRRLGTDYIDLYYQHFPDPETPIEETLSALDDLVRAGKVRYIAASNFSGWQIAEAQFIAKESKGARYIANQIEWSLLKRGVEREVVPACEHFGVGVVPYFPLASGLLTGKYKRGETPGKDTRLGAIPYFAGWATDEAFDLIEKMERIGKDAGYSILETALGYLISQPSVSSVLVGATSAQQVAANANAAVTLSAETISAMDAAAPLS